ncbi:Aste57867_16550 [Aphanomyces stellatus]|uniref:Aste57867_16550 protein n=1 Tax=Aphanomyces stellatus TaxID=120398 RepID=A0A485L6J2_9STRA|nr:hypothetical protein As57867_016493 [Aphanomyces stellatus]VFT93324.1 Aste57867_16550 [Aphanomyces stellatus]
MEDKGMGDYTQLEAAPQAPPPARFFKASLVSLFVVSLGLIFVCASSSFLPTSDGHALLAEAATSDLVPPSVPSIVFLGDSITQYGSDPTIMGFLALLANDYVRRADVLNRGAVGWTTRSWRARWPQLLATWQSTGFPSLLAIGLGTNDAAPEGDPYHVPIDEYAANLRTLVGDVHAAFPATHVFLVTPPPVDDAICTWNRTNARTGMYARACLAAASALGVSVVDAWSALQGENATDIHVHDGLHFNAKGNGLMYDLVIEHIEQHEPTLSPWALPIVF